ncbi:helix-turn-helix domain-containing protein [Dyella marensis]|uniref:transcriptional regulator n=1 Tax=Dyella marensis TaxID=500610 RepID=UPI0031D3F5F6
MGHPNMACAIPLHRFAVIDAAVQAAGGTDESLAEKIGVSRGLIGHWRCSRREIDPTYCIQIESICSGAGAADVTCEALRPDLHWVRDNGIVVGYITPLDGTEPGYAAQCVRNDGRTFSKLRAIRQNEYLRNMPGDVDEAPLVHLAAKLFPTLSPQYQGYIAGQVDEWGKEALKEIGAMFKGVEKWDDHALYELFEAGRKASDDRMFHYCYGMLYDFHDDARDALFKKFGCADHQTFPVTRDKELWEEAQRIRREHPEQIDPERALVALPAPSAAGTLDIFQHPLHIDPAYVPPVIPGLNISWVPSLKFDAPDSLETPYATLDDALNDIAGFFTSALRVLTCEDMAKLSPAGWSAVHMLCLAEELHNAVHTTLIQLTKPGAQA